MSAYAIPSGLYCAYLRKSRRDMELEMLGGGDTLARHERELRDLARSLGIVIAQTYREVVSGDTIADRPQMRQLLDDVSRDAWDGVLVVDVDRLGRGDSIDQGVIMQTFAYSQTLIITPGKIYDPDVDSDEESVEFKFFFSRFEYRTIKKRLQRGRLASAMDGCYLGSRPVYGYERYKLQGRKGWSLRPVPEKAAIVRSVFQWYAYGMDGEKMGMRRIAMRLMEMGLRTDLGNEFTAVGIHSMLKNPIYIGKIVYNEYVTRSTIVDGRRTRVTVKNPNPLLVDGLQEPIIDMDLWNDVQDVFTRNPPSPVNVGKQTVNPFIGLVRCSSCGRKMVSSSLGGTLILRCTTCGCHTRATRISIIEEAVLSILGQWLADFQAEADALTDHADAGSEAHAVALATLREHRKTLNAQLNRLCDLVEQGVYTTELFQQRHATLTAELDEVTQSIEREESYTQPPARAKLIPQIRTVLSAWSSAATAREKNDLLRSVISGITYTRTQTSTRTDLTRDLRLDLSPSSPAD